MVQCKRRASAETHSSVKRARLSKDIPIIDLTGDPDVIDLTRDSSPTPGTPSAFFNLPAELRLQIYRHLLPHGLRFHVQPDHVAAYNNDGTPILRNHRRLGELSYRYLPKFSTNLFLVNKLVSSEARAVLYGENTFSFTIDSSQHQPVSMRSPKIFGLFGTEERLPLLRNLRTIGIHVVISKNDHWAVKRHRARLEYFISVLKEHSDDENQKSLLEHLKIDYEHKEVYWGSGRSSDHWRMVDEETRNKFLFGLETLSQLRGIKNVDVNTEALPDWYAKCLQLCIQDKGGDIQPLDYPEIQVRRRDPKNRKKFQTTMQSTKKWTDPTLNWKEFADRNGIKMPADVGWFY